MWKNHDAIPTPIGSSHAGCRNVRLRTTSAGGAHQLGASSAKVTVCFTPSTTFS